MNSRVDPQSAREPAVRGHSRVNVGRGLPTGHVALLFTDIEGSTQLLGRLGERYVGVLRDHHRLLRAAIAKHHGYEVDTQGDSLFVAFPSTSDAVRAAIAAQRALLSHAWPDQEAVNVRMGIHTGAPLIVGGGYVGMDVHVAARIMAAGHGGQVLLSDNAATALQPMPPRVKLRSLGSHRLKDISEVQRLFQLEAPGLKTDFPAVKSRGNVALPGSLTPLIGRERDVDAVSELVAHGRLVTLTGPGGVGKTRLAVEVAGRLVATMPDGVLLVDLAPLTDPSQVLALVARTVGVVEHAGGSLTAAISEALKGQAVLLILDNFEHLVRAAVDVADLLRATPGLRILVTSRSALHVGGETAYEVPPLSVPIAAPTIADAHQYSAIALFIERASAGRSKFELSPQNVGAVAAICRLLEGVPLAIELAARRTGLLTADALLAALTTPLHLLAGGAADLPDRQRALRATLDWSHQLLNPQQQAVFARLAVFSGGSTLEAALLVCTAETEAIEALLDSSLLSRVEGPDGGVRLRMHAATLEYAGERLNARGELKALEELHADYFLALAEEAWRHRIDNERLLWQRRLEVDLDNVRAAMRWYLDRHAAAQALRFTGALATFCRGTGRLAEGRRWLSRALALPGGDRRSRARALCGAGDLALGGDDYEEGLRLVEQGVAAYRRVEDWSGIAEALGMMTWEAAVVRLDFARAQHLADEMAESARRSGDEFWLAEALNIRSFAANDRNAEVALLLEYVAAARRLGAQGLVATGLANLAWTALRHDAFDDAQLAATDALIVARREENQHLTSNALTALGFARLGLGDGAAAGPMFRDALRSSRENAQRRMTVLCLYGLGGCAAAGVDPHLAARLWGAAAHELALLGLPLIEPETSVLTRFEAGVRSVLGSAAFDAEFAVGGAVPLDRVVEEPIPLAGGL